MPDVHVCVDVLFVCVDFADKMKEEEEAEKKSEEKNSTDKVCE